MSLQGQRSLLSCSDFQQERRGASLLMSLQLLWNGPSILILPLWAPGQLSNHLLTPLSCKYSSKCPNHHICKHAISSGHFSRSPSEKSVPCIPLMMAFSSPACDDRPKSPYLFSWPTLRITCICLEKQMPK